MNVKLLVTNITAVALAAVGGAAIALALTTQLGPVAQPTQPTTSTTLSVTWSVAKDQPSAAEVAGCGAWLPVVVYTQAGGVVTHQDACDPNRDAAAINDAMVGALVG